MPKLALLLHLAGGTDGLGRGPVTEESAINAVAWCKVLETHARRVFSGDAEAATRSARALSRRIRDGRGSHPLRIHDIAHNGWSDLGTTRRVEDAVACLERLGHLFRVTNAPGPRGGRPSVEVYINPRLSEQ